MEKYSVRVMRITLDVWNCSIEAKDKEEAANKARQYGWLNSDPELSDYVVCPIILDVSLRR